MPKRHALTNKEWEAIGPLLPKKEGSMGRPRRDDREMVDAMLWIMATGAPWRDLPSEYGPWSTVYNRFRLWCTLGVWKRIFEIVSKNPDRQPKTEFSIIEIDSTTCKAHQHAAGGKGGLNTTTSGDHAEG